MTTATTIKIGDFVERTNGDARNRGIVIEIEGDRARINWTHRQKYEVVTTQRNFRGEGIKFKTVWSGIFVEMTSRAPRTWTAIKYLKIVEEA